MLTLVLDLGNTRLKWGVHQGNDWLSLGTMDYANLAITLPALCQQHPGLEKVIGGCVAPVPYKAAAEEALTTLSLVPRWLNASQQAGLVHNHYQNPSQLGVDRWAALVAAWHFYQKPCLIASFGTATTLDVLSDHGEFLGGAIVPGIALMQASLTSRNPVLQADNGSYQPLPQNTADAIVTGCLEAQLGALERAWARLSAYSAVTPLLILTGGGVPNIATHLNLPHLWWENLVLDGLLLLDRATTIKP